MMPLFKISMPANAGLFFRQIMSIAAFDFYDFGDVIHKYFNIAQTDSININFETIGFESSYFLINLGTLLLFYLFYILCITCMLCIKPCASSPNKRTKRLYRRLRNKTQYGSLITLIYESYTIVVLSVLINLRILSFETRGLAIMSTLCLALMILAILLPLVFILKLCCNFDKIKEPKM